MAVDLDISLTRPHDPETIRSEVQDTLRRWHLLDGNQKVRVRDLKHHYGESYLSRFAPEYADMCLSVDELAEISVVIFPLPFDSDRLACVSYAPLRGPGSKILCLATAVVLARHNRAIIEDDGELFHCGARIDPELAFDGLAGPADSADFTRRAGEAIRQIAALGDRSRIPVD